MLEYDRRQGHEEHAAEQYEDDRGDDANLGLTNIPLLGRRQRDSVREKEKPRFTDDWRTRQAELHTPLSANWQVGMLFYSLLWLIFDCLYK